MLRQLIRFFVVAALLMMVLSVAPAASGQGEDAVFPAEAWLTSTPEEQGMNSEELAAFLSMWSQDQFNLDSMLVIRNGKLVAEAYTPLNTPETLHDLHSVAKTVISALIGVLLQQGLLDGLDTPVLELFPDRKIASVDARKEALTVRDLLTMGAGLECQDTNVAPLARATSDLMQESGDYLQFALDLPMASDPGSQWNYCSAFVQILSGVITEKTGKSARDYAAEMLFKPLGITNYEWDTTEAGETLGGGGLRLTSRDAARIGYLYLNHGQWNGQQLIPADYAQASLEMQLATPWDGTTYGYLWWRLESINLSFALGYAGQYVMVFPDKDLVMVVTGGMNESLRVPLNGYPMFFAAAGLSTAAASLPENPDGVKLLTETSAKIGTAVAQPVPDAPELAAQLSGKPFFLFNPRLFISSQYIEANLNRRHLTESLNAQTFALTFNASAEAQLTLGFVDGETWILPVGLDGVYRESTGRMGTVGAKGEWLGAKTFRLYLKHVGDIYLHRIDFNFMPGAVDILSYEYASGDAIVDFGIPVQ